MTVWLLFVSIISPDLKSLNYSDCHGSVVINQKTISVPKPVTTTTNPSTSKSTSKSSSSSRKRSHPNSTHTTRGSTTYTTPSSSTALSFVEIRTMLSSLRAWMSCLLVC
eukprot:scaffold187_cov195-Ochromonas_danica.AAC.2